MNSHPSPFTTLFQLRTSHNYRCRREVPAGGRQMLPVAAAKPRSCGMRLPEELPSAPRDGHPASEHHRSCLRVLQSDIASKPLPSPTAPSPRLLSHLPNSCCPPRGPFPPSILSPLSFPDSLGFSATCEAVGEKICLYSGKTEGQTSLLPGGATRALPSCRVPVWLCGVPSLLPWPKVSPQPAHPWPRIRPQPGAPPASTSLPRHAVL